MGVVTPSAGDRAAYELQFSLDGGKTWQPFPQQVTNHATAILSGLTPVESLEGTDLQAWPEQRGPMSVEQAGRRLGVKRVAHAGAACCTPRSDRS